MTLLVRFLQLILLHRLGEPPAVWFLVFTALDVIFRFCESTTTFGMEASSTCSSGITIQTWESFAQALCPRGAAARTAASARGSLRRAQQHWQMLLRVFAGGALASDSIV